MFFLCVVIWQPFPKLGRYLRAGVSDAAEEGMTPQVMPCQKSQRWQHLAVATISRRGLVHLCEVTSAPATAHATVSRACGSSLSCSSSSSSNISENNETEVEALAEESSFFADQFERLANSSGRTQAAS